MSVSVDPQRLSKWRSPEWVLGVCVTARAPPGQGQGRQHWVDWGRGEGAAPPPPTNSYVRFWVSRPSCACSRRRSSSRWGRATPSTTSGCSNNNNSSSSSSSRTRPWLRAQQGCRLRPWWPECQVSPFPHVGQNARWVSSPLDGGCGGFPMEIGGDRGFSHGKWGFLVGIGGHSGGVPVGSGGHSGGFLMGSGGS